MSTHDPCHHHDASAWDGVWECDACFETIPVPVPGSYCPLCGSHWIHSDDPTGGEPVRPGRYCGPTCDLYEAPTTGPGRNPDEPTPSWA
jgi:hypothetical protein